MQILEALNTVAAKLDAHTQGVAFNLADLIDATGHLGVDLHARLNTLEDRSAASRDALRAGVEAARKIMGETLDNLLGHIDGVHTSLAGEVSDARAMIASLLAGHEAALGHARQAVLDQNAVMPAVTPLNVPQPKFEPSGMPVEPPDVEADPLQRAA